PIFIIKNNYLPSFSRLLYSIVSLYFFLVFLPLRLLSRRSGCPRRRPPPSHSGTHEQVEARPLAHRVMVINKGVAEKNCTPVEVYEKPASSLVSIIIG
ncbi:hypothetical protein ACQWKP_22995, partial [Salmonella enterica subsp. enterica serovar Infantis]